MRNRARPASEDQEDPEEWVKEDPKGTTFIIDGVEREEWEVLTDDPISEPDPDPEVKMLRDQHEREIRHYKNLLVRAQSASSSSIHNLHTRIQVLEQEVERLRTVPCQGICEGRGAKDRVIERVGSLLSKGHSVDNAVISALCEMSSQDRVALLEMVVEACSSGEVNAQIRLLQRSKRTKRDILASLSEPLAVRILSLLDVGDILNLRKVSKGYNTMISRPLLWRRLCQQLEWREEDGEAGVEYIGEMPDHECAWRFSRLWLREQRWKRGEPTETYTLVTHRNYVTALKLSTNLLFSGSYDGLCVRNLADRSIVAASVGPVSCIDYHAKTGVLVTGSYETGTVKVLRQVKDGWKVWKSLSGHVHGIKAVAISSQWLVSAGSDKALIVWDWRSGEKIVRFGQQTNICIGLQVIGDHVVQTTIDGLIRVFSITLQKMVAQYRISSLCSSDSWSKPAAQVTSGGTSGSIAWFQGQGRTMMCATRDKIIHLEWHQGKASLCGQGDDTRASVPMRRSTAPSSSTPSPKDPTPTRQRTMSNLTPTRTPRFPRSPLAQIATSPLTKSPIRRLSSRSSLVSSTVSTPVKSSSQGAASSPVSITPSGRSTLAKARLSLSFPDSPSSAATLALHAEDEVQRDNRCGLVKKVVPDFHRPPRLVRITPITDFERGAMDADANRIVALTRSTKSGTKHVKALVSEGDGPALELRGAWSVKVDELDLHRPERKPMCVAMDRNRVAYGCADGTIAVFSFA